MIRYIKEIWRTSALSKPKKGNNPGTSFVSMDLCVSRHESLAKEMGAMGMEIKTIKDALVGPDLQSGLVKKINDIDSNLKMGHTVIDWVKPVFIAVISAAATVVLFKLAGLLL